MRDCGQDCENCKQASGDAANLGISDTVDHTIWRVKPADGSPLVPPLADGAVDGPLHGEGVAVKDLFAVQGYAIGAGNPRFLADSVPQAATAPAVERLLRAGAHVVGIAQTDEFAYSLAGTNVHYGTPPNPAAPGRISGGSSSGPAAAVATGQASIGLGTDTAGSLRIPGSYEGLWAIRTTHGRVPRDLVHPLSEAFDTVGVLAHDPQVFVRAVDALMPDDDSAPLALGEDGEGTGKEGEDGKGAGEGGEGEATGAVRQSAHNPLQSLRLRIAPGLDRDVQPDVAAVVQAFRAKAVALAGAANGAKADETDGDDARGNGTGGNGAGIVETVDITEAQLDDWESIFQVVRGFEAWRADGAWVSRNWDALAPQIAARFERDSHITHAQYEQGLQRLDAARTTLREWMDGAVLLIPTASSVAPPRESADGTRKGGAGTAGVSHAGTPADSAAAEIAKARAATIRLTSLAGVGGLPAVSIPLRTASTSADPAGLPCGVCLVGPAGSDRSLVRLAVCLAQCVGAA
ncbi:MAG: amidase family protein [Bifidobacteriaceae bacterium]|nr:amidase family protein [Bifidobacteriaceae bacterium]